MMFEVLTFMKEEGSYSQLNDEHQRSNTCEESQDQQEAAKYFSKEHQDKRPLMTDVEGIEEDGLLIAEMHQFGKTMVDADDQAEGQAQ